MPLLVTSTSLTYYSHKKMKHSTSFSHTHRWGAPCTVITNSKKDNPHQHKHLWTIIVYQNVSQQEFKQLILLAKQLILWICSLVILQSNVYLKLLLHVDRIHYFLDLLIIWNVQVWLRLKQCSALCFRFCWLAQGLWARSFRVFDNMYLGGGRRDDRSVFLPPPGLTVSVLLSVLALR